MSGWREAPSTKEIGGRHLRRKSPSHGIMFLKKNITVSSDQAEATASMRDHRCVRLTRSEIRFQLAG